MRKTFEKEMAMSRINLMQEVLNESEKAQIEVFSFPAVLRVTWSVGVPGFQKSVNNWCETWMFLLTFCARMKCFMNYFNAGKLPWITQDIDHGSDKVLFRNSAKELFQLVRCDSRVERQLYVTKTLQMCGFSNCLCSLENKVNVDREFLYLLDYYVKKDVEEEKSALRIALTDNLIPERETWYESAVNALRAEIRSNVIEGSCPLCSFLTTFPYAVKVLWFRLAYEGYRGDNYQKVFADHFGIPLSQYRSQLMAFAGNEPFKFEDDIAFRTFVWCLRFAKEGDAVNGITSFTARAIRVMDNMEEAEACSSTSKLYSRLDSGQDICRHIRDVLDGKWRDDFVEFVHVFKNRLSFGDVAPWLDALYKSARRVVVGFRRKDARDAGRPDQLPEISLDYNGDVVLVPPSETSYEEGTYCNGDEFRFYRSTDVTTCASWRFVDGIFDCNHRSVLLKKLRRIEFKRSGNNDADEIVKYLITDEGSGIGIYNVCPSSTSGCGYSLGYRHPVFYKDIEPGRSEKLREGEYYKIVSIKGEVIQVIAYSAACPEGCPVPIDEFSKGCGTPTNVFRIPTGTLGLQIGKMLFEIVDSRVDKLEHNPNFKITCVRNKCGGPAGSRFIYKRDVYPLHDIGHVTGLWYEFDGCRHQMPILFTVNNTWETPADWLWRSNGKLIMRTDDHDERAFPVTFVDVDFSEIEEPPFSLGESRHVRIRTGTERHEYDVGPNDVEVSLEYGGIHFSPRINREGVQLCLQGKVIAATKGSKPSVEVAYGDLVDDEVMLRIHIPDAGDMKFFYGDNGDIDMLHPIDMPLRQDGTVLLRRFLDIASLKEILPVDCMISLPSGFEAYSFRIYDSKSAVLEVVHGNYEKRVVAGKMANSDDLYIRYFAPYKHHVTSNKIELAYLLAHRQDEKPRYYPLEDLMLTDDPLGLGRCVESVVAKDFFKQDIEWGTGVIGFIVESSQFGVNVQTTGFFIGAPNPAPISLDDDNLKDLRIALSERQVRRDVPMSEEDRQRLHRIESEFMSEDVQKQEALREYIRNAATVAMELNALGSINSFCNSVKNREGKLAWVSGFVFMAGWFVREFIDEKGFNDKWPFPEYWHPLLVAYRYQNVKPPEDERWELQVRYLLYDIFENYSQKDDCASLLLRVDRMIAKIVPHGIVPQDGEVVIPGKPSTTLCVFRTNGLRPREYQFRYFRLFKMLVILGEALDKWRMAPTLNELLLDDHDKYNFTLQDLREYLLFIDELDYELDKKNLFCRKFISNIASKRYFNRKNQEMSHVSV